MKVVITERRCATSSLCRQPLTFLVYGESGPSVVCEKHLGVLVDRRLRAGELSIEVKRLPAHGVIAQPESAAVDEH